MFCVLEMKVLYLFIIWISLIHIGFSYNISIWASSDIQIAENESLVINCTSSTENTSSQCEWFRYNAAINSSEVGETFNSCEFTINPVKFNQHNGEWKCKMTCINDCANVTKEIDFYITVLVEPEVFFSIEDKKYKDPMNQDNITLEAEAINVTLVVNKSNPMPEVLCQVDVIKPNPAIDVKPKYYILSKIYNSELLSDPKSANYTIILRYSDDIFPNVINVSCNISFPSWKKVKRKTLSLEQFYGVKKINLVSIEISHNSTIVKTPGEQLQLECIADGNPPPNDFTWLFKGTGQTNWTKMHCNSSICSIPNVYDREQGEYKCSTKNERNTGESIKSNITKLILHPKPFAPKPLEIYNIINQTIERVDGDQSINGSEEVNLICITKNGYPATNITWHLNNTENAEGESSSIESWISYQVVKSRCGHLHSKANLHLLFLNSSSYHFQVECIATHSEWPKGQIKTVDIVRTISQTGSAEGRLMSYTLPLVVFALMIPKFIFIIINR